MAVEYSNVEQLNVKYNNDKSRLVPGCSPLFPSAQCSNRTAPSSSGTIPILLWGVVGQRAHLHQFPLALEPRVARLRRPITFRSQSELFPTSPALCKKYVVLGGSRPCFCAFMWCFKCHLFFFVFGGRMQSPTYCVVEGGGWGCICLSLASDCDFIVWTLA